MVVRYGPSSSMISLDGKKIVVLVSLRFEGHDFA